MPNDSPAEVLHIVIRFSASVPDLSLSLNSPQLITTLSIKQQIRSHLPEPHSSSKLRLIYAGKVLPDATPLSVSLRWAPRPPPTSTQLRADEAGGHATSTGKGKEPVRAEDHTPGDHSRPPSAWTQRVYIHCSIGDGLTPQELESEATLSENLEKSLRAERIDQDAKNSQSATQEPDTKGTRTTSDAPQGFDRLLTSGFTASEVASLRSQFLHNISYTHTPDNMPTGAALRALEDRWLDSSAQDDPSAIAGGGVGGEGDGGWGGGFRAEDGGLEDLLWGSMMGFFWPVGALVWGIREEGVWTNRRKLVVITGILMNLMFGLIKWSA